VAGEASSGSSSAWLPSANANNYWIRYQNRTFLNKGSGPMSQLERNGGMSYYEPIGDENFKGWFGEDKSKWPFNTECCDTDINFKMSSCGPMPCANKCDVPNSGCAGKCADLVKKYPCATYYAPGKQYAGWCDKQCGYGVCGKTQVFPM